MAIYMWRELDEFGFKYSKGSTAGSSVNGGHYYYNVTFTPLVPIKLKQASVTYSDSAVSDDFKLIDTNTSTIIYESNLSTNIITLDTPILLTVGTNYRIIQGYYEQNVFDTIYSGGIVTPITVDSLSSYITIVSEDARSRFVSADILFELI